MSTFTKFECPIHLGKIKESEHISLDCDHNFCQNCLFETVKRNLDSNKISLHCPFEGCKMEITHYQVKNLLANTEYDNKYEDLLMQKAFEQQPIQLEKSVLCKKCKIPYYIHNNVDYFRCKQCDQTYCSICYEVWEEHHDLNCEDLRKKKITPEDKAFESYIRQNKIMKCPACGISVEKTKYCNFIYCNSSLCQKRTIFCYLCGIELNTKDANSHFVDNNAYAFQCINTMQFVKIDKVPENIISNSAPILAKNFQNKAETDTIKNLAESSQPITENEAIPIPVQLPHVNIEMRQPEKESEQVENVKENVKLIDESFKSCIKIDNQSDFKIDSKNNNNDNERISQDKKKHNANKKEITEESKENDEIYNNRPIKCCKEGSHRVELHDVKEELLESDKNQKCNSSKETAFIKKAKKNKSNEYKYCGCIYCLLI